MSRIQTAAWVSGLAATVAILTTWYVSAEADRRIAEVASMADVLQARLSGPATRPVLFGTATPGNAWACYGSAISLVKGDRELEQRVRPTERRKQDPSRLTELLDAHAEVLVWLRKGAHCREVRVPIDWTRGFEGLSRSLLDLRALGNLVVTQALVHIERCEAEAAVETLLDGAQLGRDLMHSPVLIDNMLGAAVLDIATTEAVRMNDLLEKLPPEALMRFADGLAVLDRHMQKVGPALHGEALLFARTVQGHPDLLADRSLASWRHGFSTRLELADLSLRLFEHAERTTAIAHRPWSDCRAWLSGFEQQWSETGDPALNAIVMAKTTLIARFRSLARLRLLRMALEHQLSRPVPELADPFGDQLRHGVDAEGTMRFWSKGPTEKAKLFLFPGDA